MKRRENERREKKEEQGEREKKKKEQGEREKRGSFSFSYTGKHVLKVDSSGKCSKQTQQKLLSSKDSFLYHSIFSPSFSFPFSLSLFLCFFETSEAKWGGICSLFSFDEDEMKKKMKKDEDEKKDEGTGH